MKLVSVNVGLPRNVKWQGKIVETSIWKNPVDGRIRVSKLNLEGDKQSDLSVHGGMDKAVYAYPSEHYSYWQNELSDMELPGELLARTSPQKECWRMKFESETVFRSARRSSS